MWQIGKAKYEKNNFSGDTSRVCGKPGAEGGGAGSGMGNCGGHPGRTGGGNGDRRVGFPTVLCPAAGVLCATSDVLCSATSVLSTGAAARGVLSTRAGVLLLSAPGVLCADGDIWIWVWATVLLWPQVLPGSLVIPRNRE